MDIGDAVSFLQEGRRVARKGWNGPGQYLELVIAPNQDQERPPYVQIRTAQGFLVPWVCSQSDLLATDWVRVRDTP